MAFYQKKKKNTRNFDKGNIVHGIYSDPDPDPEPDPSFPDEAAEADSSFLS